MRQGAVESARGLLVLARADRHTALPARDIARVHPLVWTELRAALLIPVLLWIGCQQTAIHPADGRGGILDMPAYQRVPAAAGYNLNPCEIDLNQRRPAPLARLEHDEPQGMPRHPLALEQTHQPPLRSVEYKGHLPARGLVGDMHTAEGPVLEIVPEPEHIHLQVPQRRGVPGVAQHGEWQPHAALAYSRAVIGVACLGRIAPALPEAMAAHVVFSEGHRQKMWGGTWRPKALSRRHGSGARPVPRPQDGQGRRLCRRLPRYMCRAPRPPDGR